MRLILVIFLSILSLLSFAQTASLNGIVVNNKGEGVEYVNIYIAEFSSGASTDIKGNYIITGLPVNKTISIKYSALGFKTIVKTITLQENSSLNIELEETDLGLNEMVVSGTMKEVSKTDSPVPVEVYTSNFFKANPAPSIFESIQQVNGVRPQLNCSVCNTGDIHINGLEGPYTSILIDGMPIVSGLSTVYGLTGIPQALIERVEIVKGPASTLYGSEAVGGLINVITKKPNNAPIITTDIMGTTWGEINTDVGMKFNTKVGSSILGVNYFKYGTPIDNNKDGFTDITLQDRFSIFNKWNFKRKDNKLFSVALRYNYEDRWGGEMNWDKEFRGGDSVYGESIFTNRWEAIGVYQLPIHEDVKFYVSGNGHYQNSVYGDVIYNANQYVGFSQLTWNKVLGKHDLLSGIAYRFVGYDDDTPATQGIINGIKVNNPSNIHLPGAFIQDEWTFNKQNKLLSGVRYDLNSLHGSIVSPRINYKWNAKNKNNTLRIGVGNGYRVVNVFTEDHAALTGARDVIIEQNLNPETSWNGNINFVKKWSNKKNLFLTFDASIYYTYFDNRIVADYETDVNKIIYDNLDGYGESKGVSFNLDMVHTSGFKANVGATIQDVTLTENGVTTTQILTENVSGVWSLGYKFTKLDLSIDYTGKLYGPMRLPTLGELDSRAEFSPWYSIQNIQLTKVINKQWEIYGGIKNLLNFTPAANSIARSFDPFDRQVQFDTDGNAIATANNPEALTFDPSYVYAANQGIRGFIGVRYILYK